jgi:hypothetical protein
VNRTISIDRNLLIECMKHTMRRVTYSYGAKAPSLDCDSSAFDKIDCSGYIRWIIYRATHGAVTMPDGSVNQHSWCHGQGFRTCAYRDCAAMDSRVRIAFIPQSKLHPGHIWLVVNGQTIESRGGKGPSRRPWNTKRLTRDVCETFVLTDPMP